MFIHLTEEDDRWACCIFLLIKIKIKIFFDLNGFDIL
jgi:hypothetical protein